MAKSIQVFDGDGIDRDSSELIEGYSVWLHINHLRPIAERYGITVHSTGDMAKLPDGYGLVLHNMILESWQALDMHVRTMSKNWTDIYINSTSNGENIGKDGLHCQLAWAEIRDGEVKDVWPPDAQRREEHLMQSFAKGASIGGKKREQELVEAMTKTIAADVQKELDEASASLRR